MENYNLGEAKNLEDPRAVGGFTKHQRIEPREVSLFIAVGVLLQESLIYSIDSPWFGHFYSSIRKLTSESGEVLSQYTPIFSGWNESYESFLEKYVEPKQSRRAVKVLKKLTKNSQYLTLFSAMAKAFMISVAHSKHSFKIANDELTIEEYRSVLEPLCSTLEINMLLVLEHSKTLIRGSQKGPLLAIRANLEDGVSILRHQLKKIREPHEYPFVVDFDNLPNELKEEDSDKHVKESAIPNGLSTALGLLVKGFEPNMMSDEDCSRLVRILNSLEMGQAAQAIQFKLSGKCSHRFGKFKTACGNWHCILCLKEAIKKAYDEELENVLCPCNKNLTMKNIQDIQNIQ